MGGYCRQNPLLKDGAQGITKIRGGNRKKSLKKPEHRVVFVREKDKVMRNDILLYHEKDGLGNDKKKGKKAYKRGGILWTDQADEK